MHSDSTDWVRCPNCNSIDVDEFVDGTSRCENCGLDVTGLDGHAAPRPEDEVPLIYPVLVWSWAPCQKCGSTHGEPGRPEDNVCWECGTPLVAIKRRACAEGFPVDAPTGTAADNSADHRFAVGDRGVSTAHRVRLVGGGPFTLLQVINVRPNGDLDVAATEDGTIWMGVPRQDLLSLA